LEFIFPQLHPVIETEKRDLLLFSVPDSSFSLGNLLYNTFFLRGIGICRRINYKKGWEGVVKLRIKALSLQPLSGGEL
jgi:hypothetical protein